MLSSDAGHIWNREPLTRLRCFSTSFELSVSKISGSTCSESPASSGCKATGQEGFLSDGSVVDFTDGSPPDSDGSNPPLLPDFDGSDFEASNFDASDFDVSESDS